MYGQTYVITRLGFLIVLLAIDLLIFIIEKLLSINNRIPFKNPWKRFFFIPDKLTWN